MQKGITDPCCKEGRIHGISDRKSTRLNSSHLVISYAVFCLKKEELESLGLAPPTHHEYCTDDHVYFAPPDRLAFNPSVHHSPENLGFFFFNDTATTEIYTLPLHDALPI